MIKIRSNILFKINSIKKCSWGTVLPYMGYIGIYATKGYGFPAINNWSEIGYRLWPFWSQTEYGFCTLVLNWVSFLDEAIQPNKSILTV